MPPLAPDRWQETVTSTAPSLISDKVYCKAWPVRHRQGLFPKTAFTLDWQAQTLGCPNQVKRPLRPGHTVRFPTAICARCSLRDQCTTGKTGRTVSIHHDEGFLQKLRQGQTTPEGRAKLRERVGVEHTLAHISAWQGKRARYRTLRKNYSTCGAWPLSITSTSSLE